MDAQHKDLRTAMQALEARIKRTEAKTDDNVVRLIEMIRKMAAPETTPEAAQAMARAFLDRNPHIRGTH
jgi:hypothetical protein